MNIYLPELDENVRMNYKKITRHSENSPQVFIVHQIAVQLNMLCRTHALGGIWKSVCLLS